jgi:hypothetical protein
MFKLLFMWCRTLARRMINLAITPRAEALRHVKSVPEIRGNDYLFHTLLPAGNWNKLLSCLLLQDRPIPTALHVELRTDMERLSHGNMRRA